MKLKLKKEYTQCYSFEFKGQKYTVEVMHIEDPYNNFKVAKGWQILEGDYFPILDGLSKTRKEALNTFLLNNA